MKQYLDAFEVARDTSKKASASNTKYRHSSVIVDRKGRIISTGRNYFAGNTVDTGEDIIDKSVHSEIHALSKVDIRRLDGAVIVNHARTNVASILARPCQNCWPILKKLGFKKVFYSTRSDSDNPEWKEEYF